MDYQGASNYMLEKLENSLPAYCHYHNAAHTRRVLAAVDVLAAGESVTNEETLVLLRTAAVYHDSGFLIQYEANESIAAGLVKELLPAFGYSTAQIDFVARLILATAHGADPVDLYERIMKDADLEYLGSADYREISLLLKREWTSMGKVFTTEEWETIQEKFLSAHQFYTETALQILEPVKQQYITMIKDGKFR